MTATAGQTESTPGAAHQAARFNVRMIAAHDGVASVRIDLPFGDERDADPLFFQTALYYAADIAALRSVRSRMDETRERPNGTISLHLNMLAEPSTGVTVRSEVRYWSTHEALSDIVATDDVGRPVARGLSAYSMRPVEVAK